MKQKRSNKSLVDIINKLKLKKVNVEIIELGQCPFQINLTKLKKTKSELFVIKLTEYEEISDQYIPLFKKPKDDDNYGLENDKIINNIISTKSADYKKDNTIYFFISYIHMKDGWYCRQVKNTPCIVLSFADIYDKLAAHNIPPENLIISTLTAYSFCYYFDGELPTEEKEKEIMHRDTRGCIMDFCTNNNDAIFSAERPFLCNECIKKLTEKLKEKLTKESLPENKADVLSKYYGKKINKELKKVKKNWLVRVKEFVQKHILLSLLFSFIFPFTISVLANISYSSSFSWEQYGLIIISSTILFIWFLILVVSILFDNKKLLKFRNRDLKNSK